MKRRLRANAVPIQLPIGEEDSFRGVIDLIGGRSIVYSNYNAKEATLEAPEEEPVPSEYQERFQQYREAMIEKIVETDDSLMIRYLEGEEIGEDDLRHALRKATINRHLVPVLCGTALRGKGIHPLLDAIVCYLPSPEEVPPVEGVDPKTQETVLRHSTEEEPLSALAFKVVTDPFVGRLVFLRIYSGKVKSGASVLNVSKGKRERMGRLLRMHANHREELEEVGAGDICAAVGLKDTFTGDTIATDFKPVILEPPKFPQPVVSVAIEPVTRADQDRLSDALHKLADEDPTFLVRFNEETGQTVISGMGELHLEVLVDRMRREFNVEARVGNPRVSYRETLTQAVRSEGRFVRQTGGRGQYGHVWIEIEPQERGSGIVIENAITGGAIPREYIRPTEQGIRQALDNGPLSGYPLVDLKIRMVDGSFHPVDSSELAFRSAGTIALREGAKRGKPVLLEPIVEMEIVTPGEYLSDILGDLGTRRAQIRNIEGQDDLQTVRTTIPLGETFAYTTALRSLSSGRATYTMEFKYYEPVPENIAKSIINVI
jgi:elongation factor G